MLGNTWVLRGAAGSIVWGYREAAAVGGWAIARDEHTRAWRLSATLTRHDPYQLRQRPLLFTTPRKGGFFCFPLREFHLLDDGQRLSAAIGPPEY